MEDVLGLESTSLDEASQQYLHKWHVLVSTTNWEKGRIISEWRNDLQANGATVAQFSDEAWSRRVGSVSGQHVGRLRRVFERFATARESYPKLSWSHFCSALDWNDAEMWLEGAVQSVWSVADMRHERWLALGGDATLQPRDEEVVAAEVDEDYADPGRDHSADATHDPSVPRDFVADTFSETNSSGDDAQADGHSTGEGVPFAVDSRDAAEYATQPLTSVGELPDDLQQAFEAFKLVVLRHKVTGWVEVSAADVLNCLEHLKQLTLTPGEAAPDPF